MGSSRPFTCSPPKSPKARRKPPKETPPPPPPAVVASSAAAAAALAPAARLASSPAGGSPCLGPRVGTAWLDGSAKSMGGSAKTINACGFSDPPPAGAPPGWSRKLAAGGKAAARRGRAATLTAVSKRRQNGTMWSSTQLAPSGSAKWPGRRSLGAARRPPGLPPASSSTPQTPCRRQTQASGPSFHALTRPGLTTTLEWKTKGGL
mmetsp:Transcript_19516/g.44277  ORF Transcript_19516/g.44277 Transcript_19516/m.44277 type:complete len:206 (+) Transcript_19516:312-929(+)